MSDIYLSITETPTVVTLTNPLIPAAAVTVTVGSSVAVSNFPAVTTVAGTVTANVPLVQTTDSQDNLSLGFAGIYAIGKDWNSDLAKNFNLDPAGQVRVGSLPPISGTVTANVFGYNPVNDQNEIFEIFDVVDQPSAQKALPVMAVGSLPPVSGTITVGNSVTVANFPSTQTIAGTVTANLSTDSFTNFQGAIASDDGGIEPSFGVQLGFYDPVLLEYNTVKPTNPLPISGTVTVGNSVTVANFPATQVVSVSNLPAAQVVTGTVALDAASLAALENVTVTVGAAISGSVTVNNFPASQTVQGTVTVANFPANQAVSGTVTANISGTVPVSGTFWQSTQPVSVASLPASTVTVSSLPAVSGTVTVSGVSSTVTARLVNPAGSTVTYAEVGTAGSPSIDVLSVQGVSGGTALPVQLPRVTLIDGSGTVTTANSAITVFASSSTRSYLLVQVTTGSAFVNVGASATTVNGLSLTAGQGYAWENTIPQGLVSLISTVTSSRWVAKEA